MSRKIDKINCLDLESSCWQGNPPPGQESEIIEIGICTIDAKTHVVDEKRSIIVRPERSKISEFCEKLTSLTQADVDKGISLHEAFNILRRDYRSQDRPWVSCGVYDRSMIERECRAKNLKYPMGRSHTNVKSVFACVFGLDYELDMVGMVEHLGRKVLGKHHRGDDDAFNVGLVYADLLSMCRIGWKIVIDQEAKEK